MSKVADSDSILFLNVRKEGPFVVDFEIENSMLIGQPEASSEDGGSGSGACRFEGEPVEGGEHREFQLKRIALGRNEGDIFIPRILGYFNFICLYMNLASCRIDICGSYLPHRS